MKKILIIETSLYWGHDGGGSFIQAKFYQLFLQKNGFIAEIFRGDRKKNRIKNFISLVKKIQLFDCVVGFGTPLLGVYLQWLCFILNKKGIFCVDTIMIYKSILTDQFRRGVIPLKMIVQSLQGVVHSGLLTAFSPPKKNFKFLASSEYIKKILEKSFCESSEERCLYARVLVKKKTEKKLPKTDRNVLFYGALFRGRGIIDLLNACKILWYRGYKFNLIILGHPVDSFTEKKIKKEISKEKKNNIFLYGEVKSPEKYLQKATVVALPFRYPCSFQTPLTLLEPMFLGVPVITTDVGSHGEWVMNGKTGLFCERENPQDLAEKIAMLLDNSILAKKFARNAEALLRIKYNTPNVLLELLKKYGFDQYRAKQIYAKIDPAQYLDSRFQSPAGKMIDDIEKSTVRDLLRDCNFTKPENNLHILDAATGPGRLAIFLEKNFPEAKITGIDINNNMLVSARKMAAKSNSNIIFQQGDLYRLPFSENNFNAVVGLRFSMHLPNFKTVFKEFSRVLKDDGVLVFDIFNADSLLKFKPGELFYKLPEISRLAKECGFQLQTYKGIVLLGETVLRRCPPKLLFLLKPLFLPPNTIGRFSTKLVLSFKKVK